MFSQGLPECHDAVPALACGVQNAYGRYRCPADTQPRPDLLYPSSTSMNNCCPLTTHGLQTFWDCAALPFPMACRKKGFRYRCAYTATHIQNPQYLELAGRWNNSSRNWRHHSLVWIYLNQRPDRTEPELEQRQHISGTAAAHERPRFDIEMPDDTIIHDHGITLGSLTQTENTKI